MSKFAEKNRAFIEKLRNLPEKKKKILLWSIVAAAAVIMLFFWINSVAKTISKIGESAKSINLPSVDLSGMPKLQLSDLLDTADWQTYTNNKYSFQINYPAGWTFREYKSGSAFFPENKSSENITGNGSINIGFYARGLSYCKIPFEDYVKIAGPAEIQNYESLNSISTDISSDGNAIYQITWNYKDMQNNEKVSLPITYFGAKDSVCGSVDASLNDSNYSDIYNKIISTFKFIK